MFALPANNFREMFRIIDTVYDELNSTLEFATGRRSLNETR